MGKLGPLLYIFVLIGLSVHADDNHIHVEQVNGGDNMDLQIDQIGYDNMIKFSFDHQNNIMEFEQNGNNNYIGWTDTWGSGYNWGTTQAIVIARPDTNRPIEYGNMVAARLPRPKLLCQRWQKIRMSGKYTISGVMMLVAPSPTR